MKITCYQSEEGRWLAHAELGRDLFMPFFGATKAEAVARAEDWHKRETARSNKLDTAATLVAPASGNLTGEAGDYSQHRFAGKVWMLNRQTGERTRVEADEIASYEAKGFVKCGPRSK